MEERENMKKVTFRGEELLAEPPVKLGKYTFNNLHPILTPEERERREKEQLRKFARLLMN